ncbi:MAG: iron-containing alcohol dehydrogenase [Lachnospiraceae bacterium]|nr:iron-containing alcohol dehydrogenase [Lachnospiraceae bacterium]
MNFQHASYRMQQSALAAVIKARPESSQELIHEYGAVHRIPALLTAHGKQRILLVTTAGMLRRGSLDGLLEELKEKAIHCVTFTDLTPDPTVEQVENGVYLFLQNHCEAIVAIGGGSVLDCAKIIGARIAQPKKSVAQMEGVLKIRAKLPLMIAVPTTAGTGSEVTVAAVITDEKEQYKHAISDFCLEPDVAILDPILTLSLPQHTTAYSGLDAMTHAVEAYTNRYSAERFRKHARKAVRLIHHYLPLVVLDPEDVVARDQMLVASYEAGIAFTNAFVGYVHAIAHGIGGLYHVPHGLACAVLLPKVMESYGKAVYEPLAELADFIGLNESGESKEEKARAFIKRLYDLNDLLGIPKNFPNVKEEDIPELARRAIAEANPGYPVPVIWSQQEMADHIRAYCIG